MTTPRQIRDPVHGFIKVDQKESDIIDTSVFQRLRRIRQLAFAYLLYPGALHTRFDHSLGVFHISGLLADWLRMKGDQSRLVQHAALLHDLGHGPFSHVSEDVLKVYANVDKLAERAEDGQGIHELVTQDLILASPELEKALGRTTCERIAGLLAGDYGEPLMYSIVSGPLDADKQDYLLRDSQFCGVKYGVFDIDQLRRQLVEVKDPSQNQVHLGITEDGKYAMEQFVLARHYLTRQVYTHRVRRITDQMLVRAICLGIDADNIDELHAIYAYDGTETSVDEYAKWDDQAFLATFCDQSYAGKYCHGLLRRLHERRLLKEVYNKRLDRDFPQLGVQLRSLSEPSNRAERSRLESQLAESIREHASRRYLSDDFDGRLVILDAFTLKSARPQPRDDESQILVQTERRPIPFGEASELFGAIDKQLDEAYVAVYAPVFYHTEAERDALLRKLDSPITKTIESFFTEGDGDDGARNQTPGS